MANPVEISSRGFGALVVLTRTNDTSVYLANDVIGAATGATAAVELYADRFARLPDNASN